MGILSFLNDERFNVFFSVLLGIGLVSIFRPICSGIECNISKPPTDSDFDKHVYRIGSKCYEFKSQIIDCPSSGAIEAFRECQGKPKENFLDQFARRNTPIRRCE
jgi:hypothetical protein